MIGSKEKPSFVAQQQAGLVAGNNETFSQEGSRPEAYRQQFDLAEADDGPAGAFLTGLDNDARGSQGNGRKSGMEEVQMS